MTGSCPASVVFAMIAVKPQASTSAVAKLLSPLAIFSREMRT